MISIEASRSDMELLRRSSSSSIPTRLVQASTTSTVPACRRAEEIDGPAAKGALRAIPPDRLWVNPDCGLKTRGWPEVHAALRNMVEAAKSLRPQHGVTTPAALGKATDREPVGHGEPS